MSEHYTVGLVGARGHTGRELLRLIADHPRLQLAFAGSREFAGKPVSEMASEMPGSLRFEAIGPDEAAQRGADVVVLAMPDGAAAPFVDAFERQAPQTLIIDLSADYRFDDSWTYGLPELLRVKGMPAHPPATKRIANPGCYATAMQLALAPLLGYRDGVPSVFGVSGYSGAGTRPSPKNDPARLADNLMPYKLTGHNHEREATRHLGTPVRFSPHVHPAFSGIVVTAHAPLRTEMNREEIKSLFVEAYANEPLVSIQDGPPELAQGTGINGVLIGGFEVGVDGRHAVIVAAEDNLLKGAAVQAIQNINLAFGLEELSGIKV